MHINILFVHFSVTKWVYVVISNMYAPLIFLVSLLLHIIPSDLPSQLSKYVIICSLVVKIYADTEYEIREKVKYCI